MNNSKGVIQYGPNTLEIRTSVLEQLELHSGQRVDVEQWWQCFKLNEAANTTEEKVHRLVTRHAPETKALETKLANVVAKS